MGIRIQVGTYVLQASDYSVDEAATPLAAGDSSGGTGSISFTVAQPDEFAPNSGITNNAWRRITEFGPDILLDLPVRLLDSRKGFTLGTVIGVQRLDDQGTLQISCSSRLADINAYGIQAAPFVGTLGAAFTYYLGLANITTDLFVDDSLSSRPVVFPGWTGELWYHLKQMAVSQDCDISLVSGVVLLRPIRARVATRGRDIGRSRELSQQTLAQSVEVYQYSNRAITNQLVYPPGGWTPEVEVMNVNAGETSEYVLDLSASVSSIQQPVMQTFVSEGYSASSVYTIVANDGHPVSYDAWTRFGGSLKVAIEPDTKRLRVNLIGATGLPTTEGGPAKNFSVALASDTTGNRYSTFRIVGTGVAFDKVKKRVRTGVPANRTATEVGVTIDNPFISTVDDLYRAGTRAAKQFSGQVPGLSGSVTAINRLGDTGQAEYPTYGEVQTELYAELGTPNYADVQTYYLTTLSLTTYESVRQYWFTFVRDDFTNQVFGNVNGARIYDKKSRRWYRIRQGTLTADKVTFTAEDDLTHGDIEGHYTSRTYGDVELVLGGLTYKQADLVGLYG